MYLTGGAITYLFGFWYKNLQYFSVLFLPLSAFFLFLYVKKLTNKDWWAFFSAVFFVFSPQIWQQSRYFMLDLPLTAFILISLYFLECSNGFRKNSSTFLFFFFAAIAQLTKWYAFLYLAPLFIFTLIKNKRQPVFKKVFLGILISSIFVLPWYLLNLPHIIKNASLFLQPDYNDPLSFPSLRNSLYYLIQLLNYQVVSLQFLWLIISIFLFWKSKFPFKKPILLQILIIYLIFTFLGNKNPRYTLPLIPFYCLIMGYGLQKTLDKSKTLAISIFSILFIFSLGLFAINSFSIPLKSNLIIGKEIFKNIEAFNILDLSSQAIPYHYQKQVWSPKKLIDDLNSFAPLQKNLNILVLANNQQVSVAGLRVFSLKNYSYLHFNEPPADSTEKLPPENFSRYLNKYDYIIVPNKYVAPWGHAINFLNMDELRKYLLVGTAREYALVKNYPLFDSDTLFLLRKDPAYNILNISISNNTLKLIRPPAVSSIYFQFMDENGNWTQEFMPREQIEYIKNLANIGIIRIDYPPGLWQIKNLENWQYNGEKQFNLLK